MIIHSKSNTLKDKRRGKLQRKWLVETEIVSELEEQYFIEQTPGQIVANMLGAFSKNNFTKMKISRDPV